MEKKKIVTIVVLATTAILSLVAVFMALKLYQIGKKPTEVAKKVEKKEKTAEVLQQEQYPCQLSFVVSAETSPSPSPSPSVSPSPGSSNSPSPSPSPSPGVSISPSPSPSTLPGCWDYCTYDSQCPSSLKCLAVNGVNRCVNSTCPTESDCVCGVTPAVLPSPSPVTYQPATQLPSAGTSLPTLLLGVGGALLIILGLLL